LCRRAGEANASGCVALFRLAWLAAAMTKAATDDAALTPLVTTTDLPLPVFRRGKVRDVYEVRDGGRDLLLMVATDRISAFDVVLEPGIPDKGACLTQISNFWFDLLANEGIENHLVATRVDDFPATLRKHRDVLHGHAVLVERLEPLPVECIVRGYITGSGWNDYQKTGSVCGITLPDGLPESERLAAPIFTPSSKADEGHDVNISFAEVSKVVGATTAAWLRDTSLRIYNIARDHAAKRGILLADTKFEFGKRPDGTIVLMDEVLTPDSSRFWPADGYEVGHSQPSFDKQFVRDYLETLDWDKTPPGPRLPEDIVRGTSARYKEAYERLTGKAFSVA
jgi:phosphoribosylaminoimidazole-succinocarboxamide synthase